MLRSRRFPQALGTASYLSRQEARVPSHLQALAPAMRPLPRRHAWGLLFTAVCLAGAAVYQSPVHAGTTIKGQETDSETPWEVKEELREDSTLKNVALAPVRVIAWPGRKLLDGMEAGLLHVEENRALTQVATFQQRLAARGLFPLYGGLGDGAGIGGGILIRRGGRTPEEDFVSLRALASTKNFHDYELTYGDPALIGPLGVRWAAYYNYRPQVEFFGIGPNSKEENRTNYRDETIGTALGLTLRPKPRVELGLTGRLRRVNIGEGTDRRFPTSQEVFTAEEVPGLQDGADVLSVEGEIAHDSVDRPGAPSRGGRALLRAGIANAVDGQNLGYTRFRAEVTRFLTLYPRRVLAFHGLGVITDRRQGKEAAFFDLPQLGGSGTMRGFREQRFRDVDAVLFMLEYRWELWRILDAALFADEGQVFDNLEDDFKFSRLRTSFGGGFRFKSPAGVFLRYDIGHSQEGTRHFIKFNQSF
jgi:hypothetical protein